MRNEKKISKKTVGLCTVCEQYIKHGSYKLMRVDGKPDTKIVCEWCEADLKELGRVS